MKNKREFHPQKYLSYSQIRLLKENKEDFIKRYFYGEDVIDKRFKKYVEFGQKVHELIENKDQSISNVLDKLPNYKERERELKVDYLDVPLFGIIDGLTKDEENFVAADFKTSKRKWTKKEVDNNEQITFYYVLMDLFYNEIPRKFYIHRIETAENEWGGLYLTGVVDTIETTRKKDDIQNMKLEAVTCWNIINKLMEQEINKLF